VATIVDVARHAGVSIATVSRVLSRPGVVAPNTRRRVMQAVASLGYATNAAAKHLRTQRSGKILVILPDISNPFYSRVLQCIDQTAQREGFAVVLAETRRDPSREERYTDMLRRRETEGLIVLGHSLLGGFVAASAHLGPQAAIVSGCEAGRGTIPSVHIDNHAAGADAMDHLYRLGHRRIGVVTGPEGSGLSGDRLRGALARAEAAGLERMVAVHPGDFTMESGERAAERLLSDGERPTALFCLNDQMALGAMGVARRRGIAVPDALSVIGVDDIAFARYSFPALTTIAQPAREMGQEVVRVLLGIIRGEPVKPVSVILRHHLIARASTGPV
jgi:LacI family repressor for deo operon, udp, cdd, tsx, nupC, and nupG